MKTYKTIYINGKQKRLHRYVMECHLGRELYPHELVHHINHNKHDNRIENLEILNRSNHAKLHQKETPFGQRFKQKHFINPEEVLQMFKHVGMAEIAEHYGCSVGTIQNIIKDNNIRAKIRCSICGEYAKYRKQELCSKHYLQRYYQQKKC